MQPIRNKIKLNPGIKIYVNHFQNYRAPIDEGSQRTVVIGDQLITSDGLAVDWIYNHLYWTDTGKNHIELSDLQGNMRKILIRDKLEEPRAIALNPLDGYVYIYIIAVFYYLRKLKNLL